MRMRTGLAGIGLAFGCLAAAGCGNEHPTGADAGAKRHALQVLPEEYVQNGGHGEAATQSDTTSQRGIGGFGSGN